MQFFWRCAGPLHSLTWHCHHQHSISALPFPSPFHFSVCVLKMHTVIAYQSEGGSLFHPRQFQLGHPTNHNVYSVIIRQWCMPFPRVFCMPLHRVFGIPLPPVFNLVSHPGKVQFETYGVKVSIGPRSWWSELGCDQHP